MLKQLSYYGLINLVLIFTSSCDPGSCSESFITNGTEANVVIIAYSYHDVDTIAQLLASAKSESRRICGKGKQPPTAFGSVELDLDSVDLVFNDTVYLRYWKGKTGCIAKNPLCLNHYEIVGADEHLALFEYRITQEDFEAAKPF